MDKNIKWIKYQMALLPEIPPHCELIKNNNLQTILREKRALFARYTSDFDCGYETEWWYCIKDDLMDLESLQSKKRNVINKGLKFVDVVLIDPTDYVDAIYEILKKCQEGYNLTHQAGLCYEEIYNDLKEKSRSTSIEYWGCIYKETGLLCGYAICELNEEWVSLSTVKVHPDYLSKQVNAALGYIICKNYLNSKRFRYISDGERNIRHQTSYQDYLIKYFGFRKAYCKLHIEYRPTMEFAVTVLYPFRKIIKKVARNQFLYNVSCTLDQEWIRRECSRK